MITAEKNIVKFKAKDGREVTIRPAQASDAEHITTAVREIIEAGEFIQKDEPRTVQEEQDFIASVEKNNHMYVVAEVVGEVLGIARVLRGEIKMKRHTGLFRTWLISKAQGMGIGKQFMNYTLNWCKEMNKSPAITNIKCNAIKEVKCMPKIISVGFGVPPYELTQQDTLLFAKELFSESFKDINR